MTKKTSKTKWLLFWIIALIDVFMFSSAINCIFQWFAYGHSYDMAAFLLSLTAGIVLYIFAVSPKKEADMKKRLFMSLITIVAWFFLMPVVMQMTPPVIKFFSQLLNGQ